MLEPEGTRDLALHKFQEGGSGGGLEGGRKQRVSVGGVLHLGSRWPDPRRSAEEGESVADVGRGLEAFDAILAPVVGDARKVAGELPQRGAFEVREARDQFGHGGVPTHPLLLHQAGEDGDGEELGDGGGAIPGHRGRRTLLLDVLVTQGEAEGRRLRVEFTAVEQSDGEGR